MTIKVRLNHNHSNNSRPSSQPFLRFASLNALRSSQEYSDKLTSSQPPGPPPVPIPYTTKTLMTLGPGDYFGERALLTDEPRAASCTAQGNVLCQILDAETFNEALSGVQDLLGDRIQVRGREERRMAGAKRQQKQHAAHQHNEQPSTRRFAYRRPTSMTSRRHPSSSSRITSGSTPRHSTKSGAPDFPWIRKVIGGYPPP